MLVEDDVALQDNVNVMLTTVDNPYNPHSQYKSWETWDLQTQYKSNSYLDRVAVVAEGIRPLNEEAAILTAIRDICKLDPSHRYRAIRPDGSFVSLDEMEKWLCG